jgi:hypothetical protein
MTDILSAQADKPDGQPHIDTNNEATPDPAVEKEARALGWVPEGEWKGDPPRSGFKSAEEFVQRGKEVLPIVNKRLTEENASLKDQIAQLKSETSDQIERMGRMSKVALDRQRTQIVAEFEAKKELAVETGDKAAYREADKGQKDALSEFDKAIAEPEEKTAGKDEKKDKFEIPAPIKQTVEAWVAENPWFNSEDEMNAVANARHAKLLKEKPGMSLQENLADVRAYVQKRFPEKFAEDPPEDEDPPPRRGSPVEGGTRVNGSGGSKSAWSQIPKAAQAQADRFIKEDSLFLEPGETVEKDIQKARERYAAKYMEQK